MDPPKGQHYLRLVNGTAEVANAIQPFGLKWKVAKDSEEIKQIQLSAEDEEKLQQLSAMPLDDLAFALDKARNNESLVAFFIYRGEGLLFPGDAQYGNWRAWIENEDSSDVLQRVTFIKVAHHGSVNATPVSVVEGISKGIAAMISTQSEPWKSIPQNNLMGHLGEKTGPRIVRSDWIKVDGAPKPLTGAVPKQPTAFPKGFHSGQFWVDYLTSI
jgi:beta-lactamase superfamily II metal-dependent hydrolase